jgi:hypothetical protein
MQKAHLFEALYLVNRGIDEAVSGVLRLKKAPDMFMETYHKSMAGLERRRSLINLQFMTDIQEREEADAARFEEEFNVWLSDEPLTDKEICKLMRVVEDQRKAEGKAPMVEFLPATRHRKSRPKTTRIRPSPQRTKAA